MLRSSDRRLEQEIAFQGGESWIDGSQEQPSFYREGGSVSGQNGEGSSEKISGPTT
jgi:hypothetical protein